MKKDGQRSEKGNVCASELSVNATAEVRLLFNYQCNNSDTYNDLDWRLVVITSVIALLC